MKLQHQSWNKALVIDDFFGVVVVEAGEQGAVARGGGGEK